MKLYKFYKRPTDEALKNSVDLSIEDKYPLYAFTKDKKLRNEFLNVRDKDKFIEIKTDVTKEEYVEFANKNSKQSLQYYVLDHLKNYRRKEKDEQIKNIIQVKIVCTWNEIEFVEAYNDTGISEISDTINYHIFPFMLKEKYLNALKKLEYIGFWYVNANIDRYESIMTGEELDNIGYEFPDITFDELSTFVMLFGDTMK